MADRHQRREGTAVQSPTPTLHVALRGSASYGPIWSGKLGAQAEIKTDELDEKRRVYPLFAPAVAK